MVYDRWAALVTSSAPVEPRTAQIPSHQFRNWRLSGSMALEPPASDKRLPSSFGMAIWIILNQIISIHISDNVSDDLIVMRYFPLENISDFPIFL